ncbi:hypothetical protein [Sphingomonas sp. SRS2]|uniref:hypothetical protein n=1 Tax=Sphingomonas sp. SRS2 TaxID=133190 RepID=UPI001F257203|nr:hypothetical protein [Sphingomonas sp. SRS2]
MTIIGVALSTAILILLCLGDPKRRRTARLDGTEMGTATRRTLTVLACMPGLYFALTGSGAAFFIWLGGCGVAGWLIALLFRQPGQNAA